MLADRSWLEFLFLSEAESRLRSLLGERKRPDPDPLDPYHATLVVRLRSKFDGDATILFDLFGDRGGRRELRRGSRRHDLGLSDKGRPPRWGQVVIDLEPKLWSRQILTDAAVPQIVAAYRRARGKQRAPVKKLVSLRLDPDVVAHFRATGPGWQGRINQALRKVARLVR